MKVWPLTRTQVINAIFAIKKATPPELFDSSSTSSPTSRVNDIYHVPSSTILSRGSAFFDQTYGKVADTVMENMEESGTEDLGATARLIYGYIVSNTTVLSAMETSFILIAGLIPQDVNPQLKGHLHGAINNGATKEQVAAVREVVIRICEAGGMKKLDRDSQGGWGWREEVASL